MAALSRRARVVAATLVALALGAVVGASCGKLVGLGGPVTPLATVRVQVTGDVAPFIPDAGAGVTPSLRIALVWGQEWLPEPLCLLPADSDAGAEVKAAGCPDVLGFVPMRVAADAPVAADGTATLELVNLPSADVMVGDVTARVAYGSLYLYDDRNGNGTLDLWQSEDFDRRNAPPVADASTPLDIDVVYGASFVSMTLPDQRVAFREGAFDATIAFYPRAGCPDPPPLFSILSAGGFSLEDALAAALTGGLPQEDPATCGAASLDEATVSVPPQAPEPIKQLRCLPADTSGFTSYRKPPADPPDLANLTWACAPLPQLPGDDAGVADGGVDVSGMQQLIIASTPGMECRKVWHYVPRGCRDDPGCATPAWGPDDGGTAASWSWWPCADWP